MERVSLEGIKKLKVQGSKKRTKRKPAPNKKKPPTRIFESTGEALEAPRQEDNRGLAEVSKDIKEAMPALMQETARSDSDKRKLAVVSDLLRGVEINDIIDNRFPEIGKDDIAMRFKCIREIFEDKEINKVYGIVKNPDVLFKSTRTLELAILRLEEIADQARWAEDPKLELSVVSKIIEVAGVGARWSQEKEERPNQIIAVKDTKDEKSIQKELTALVESRSSRPRISIEDEVKELNG